ALPPFTDSLLTGELAAAQAGGEIAAVRPAAGLAEDAGAELAPRRGDDDRLRQGATRGEVRRRLVHLVDQADRHEHEAGAHVRLRTEQIVEIGELDVHVPAHLR